MNGKTNAANGAAGEGPDAAAKSTAQGMLQELAGIIQQHAVNEQQQMMLDPNVQVKNPEYDQAQEKLQQLQQHQEIVNKNGESGGEQLPASEEQELGSKLGTILEMLQPYS